MLEEMKISKKKKNNNNSNLKENPKLLVFPLHKKGTVPISPLYNSDTNNKSEIISTLREFMNFSTKEKIVPYPREELVQITETYNKTTPNLTTQKSQIVNTIETKITKKPNFEKEKITKQKTIAQLNLSIMNLTNKILHMKNEYEKNLSENYKSNEQSMKIIFNQEKIRHEQTHFDNDIPILRSEVNGLKTNLNNLTEQNHLFELQNFKIETEIKIMLEDIKKMNILLDSFSKENNQLAYQIIQFKNKNHELRMKVEEQTNHNVKFYKNINSLISIK